MKQPKPYYTKKEPEMPQTKPLPSAIIWRVTERDGSPIRTSNGLFDMLRHDLAFHSHEDTSLIVFPVFKARDGLTKHIVTLDRWRSFGFKLNRYSMSNSFADLGNWITYRHDQDPLTLQPHTMSELIKSNKWVVVRWR